ncbi:ABC-type transporter, integral membrane subunit [Thalassoporum mexicanum PCC 7367]|uniref:ABC transporter permease n=1 Tax=Thalassoporum mexicanum TaxID=3457544 RepID=UPI00029F85ED|nr:ABC transporter permease [Pseudanabaena sp. PCC 7367]AFY70774.1 ABC-type transporter, integral membrane subunit [Pseudanabaena sp. PCC 7367]
MNKSIASWQNLFTAKSVLKNLRKLVSLDVIAPMLVGVAVLLIWEVSVRVTNTPPFILPGPWLVLKTMRQEWGNLFPALLNTLAVTVVAFLVSAASGLFVAILFAQSKWIEKSLYPYAVVIQTTPLAAIAPLIIIWLKNNTFGALVICAWIAALFPVISNTTFGLNSIDSNLGDLFKLYKASRWQTMLYLRLPSALPYFLAGLRISGGLALIGAVVAEFVAGTGGSGSGIAYKILIAGYNLQVPKMFAALLMTTALGIIIFVVLSALSDLILRDWHESSVQQEGKI